MWSPPISQVQRCNSGPSGFTGLAWENKRRTSNYATYFDRNSKTRSCYILNASSYFRLSSGKLTVCHWIWPFIVDLPIKNCCFSIVRLVYQRVISMIFRFCHSFFSATLHHVIHRNISAMPSSIRCEKVTLVGLEVWFSRLSWLSPKWGLPWMKVSQNGWFIWENPIKMDDDWGYPYFKKPRCWRFPEELPFQWAQQFLLHIFGDTLLPDKLIGWYNPAKQRLLLYGLMHVILSEVYWC